MRKTIPLTAAALAIAGLSPAVAQQQPQAQAAPNEYAVKLTLQEIQTAARGLVALPYMDVAPLLNKLESQVKAEDEARKKAAEANVKKDDKK